MNQRHNGRSSSHGRKLAPAHARPSKPPLLHRRGLSYNHVQSHGSGSSSAKSGAASTKNVSTEVASQDDEDETGLESFLQFCATCEKQIVTPGKSILYCSEACRRKDVSRPTPIQTTLSPSRTQSTTSYFDMAPADIVQQRSPTMLRPTSLTFSDLSISELSSPNEDCPKQSGQHEPEFTEHLAQFDSQDFACESTWSRRPRATRASTATESGLPSLTNTPSSSLGTVASILSFRPLPPRHDPTTCHCPTRSIDLVTPSHPTTAPSSPAQLMKESSLKSSASTLTSFRVAEADDISFQRRKPSWRHSDQASSSLKQLFSHEAMQGAHGGV